MVRSFAFRNCRVAQRKEALAGLLSGLDLQLLFGDRSNESRDLQGLTSSTSGPRTSSTKNQPPEPPKPMACLGDRLESDFSIGTFLHRSTSDGLKLSTMIRLSGNPTLQWSNSMQFVDDASLDLM
jgi:hypothetical protein